LLKVLKLNLRQAKLKRI